MVQEVFDRRNIVKLLDKNHARHGSILVLKSEFLLDIRLIARKLSPVIHLQSEFDRDSYCSSGFNSPDRL